MLWVLTLLGAFTRVLVMFRPCFTVPTFETFMMMVVGLFAQPVGRTVCGMLTGAGLARIGHHREAPGELVLATSNHPRWRLARRRLSAG